MNSNRVPLSALQIQQLARQSKPNNTFVSYKKYYSNCQDSQKIEKKIILEILASKQEPFPEFLYGVHVQDQKLHICPTPQLMKVLEQQYSLKEITSNYEQVYQGKFKVYINISEIDLIIYLLNNIVNQKLDLSRNREIFRKQSVQELVNLRKLPIEDPKIKQVISMVTYIYNSSQIKLSGHTLVKKNPPLSKDKHFQYITRNINQIATLTFLKYCVHQQILIPEILPYLKLKGDEFIIDDYDFILSIPDSQLYTPLKEKLRYDKFQKITTLQSYIEYEYFLVTTLDITYPMPTITNTILQIVNQIDNSQHLCSNRLLKIINDPIFDTLINNLNQSQHPLVQNVLASLLRLNRKPNKIPKLKLKITKS